jgi:Flp pilus assembly protein TadD
MFSARNVHYAILGIILGATSGYIFAFYQVQRSAPPAPAAATNVPENHPQVTEEQMLALFKEALEKNPNEPELMTRYANYLFDQRKFGEAAEWYRKVLSIQPDNLNVRTDMATTLWNMGDTKGATAEYEAAHRLDPKHVPTLHNLVVAHMDGTGDLQKAEELLRQLETLDPNYSGLPALQVRLQERKSRAQSGR